MCNTRIVVKRDEDFRFIPICTPDGKVKRPIASIYLLVHVLGNKFREFFYNVNCDQEIYVLQLNLLNERAEHSTDHETKVFDVSTNLLPTVYNIIIYRNFQHNIQNIRL